MTVRFIFGFIPVPVIYCEWFCGRFDARSFGVVVAVHPDHRDSRPLLEHELQHCRRFYRSLGVSAILYLLSKRSRFKQEVECYRVQLSHMSPISRTPAVERFARCIVSDYGLDVTFDEAYAALLRQ